MGRADKTHRLGAGASGDCRGWLHVFLGVVVRWLAGLRVEPRCPVVVVSILLAVDELAGRPVEFIDVAITAGVDPPLARLAVYGRIPQRMFADLVVVKRIVRGVLEGPLHLAGIWIHCQDRKS